MRGGGEKSLVFLEIIFCLSVALFMDSTCSPEHALMRSVCVGLPSRPRAEGRDGGMEESPVPPVPEK